MTVATARRTAAPAAPARPPLGCGELHTALLAADAVAHVAALARSTGCDPDELSADHGKSLDMRRIFEAMRKRGYVIGDPVRPQAQPRLHQGVTIWLVNVVLPQGCGCTLAFHEPTVPA